MASFYKGTDFILLNPLVLAFFSSRILNIVLWI